MKLKAVIGSMVALTLGLGSMAYAAGDYYPPERIHCMLNNVDKLSCDEFNRQYLAEDTTNADFPKGKDDIFHFVSAVAYMAPRQDQASVFYTYNNAKSKMVKLKTINTAIRPDLKNSSWKKFKDDVYTCVDIETKCPITNLPSFSK